MDKKDFKGGTLDIIPSLGEAMSLKEVEALIRTINSKLHNLWSLNLGLFEVNFARLVLISKIVCNKLPQHYVIKLFWETSTNYPNFNQLLTPFPLRYRTPCILLAAYPRFVHYDRVSVDQCHILLCPRTVAWTSDITYTCAIGLRGSKCLQVFSLG